METVTQVKSDLDISVLTLRFPRKRTECNLRIVFKTLLFCPFFLEICLRIFEVANFTGGLSVSCITLSEIGLLLSRA